MVMPIAEDRVKLLLNLLLLAAEALPRGGTIAVRLSDAGGGLRIDLTSSGEGATLSPECLAGLTDEADVSAMTPRTVQGFFTARYARSLDSAVEINKGEKSVHISCNITSNN
jgi:histidine phosphotransferase ChpT